MNLKYVDHILKFVQGTVGADRSININEVKSSRKVKILKRYELAFENARNTSVFHLPLGHFAQI